MNRKIPLAPSEGWLTVGLVALISLIMAYAIDDSRWVLGRDAYLDFLPLAAIGGVLVGFIGAKVRWGRWLTFVIGAIFAALLLPLLVATNAFPHGASPHDLYQATAKAVVAAWTDLAINRQAATSQYLHHILAIGILVWGTAMFASYATFGHRRPLNGIVAVGFVLVGNMCLTLNDQLPYLVLFSLASLFLLIRGHVFDEQSEWIRRRIGDPATISSVYLRGGTVFIAVAVLSSFTLTQTAASKPLAGVWDDVGQNVIGLTRSFSRFLPTGGANRGFGVSFGPNAQVLQVWTTDSSVAFTVKRPPADTGKYYWRAWTYDQIGLTAWGTTQTSQVVVPSGDRVLQGLADDVGPDGRHEVTFTVTPVGFNEPWVLSPQTPTSVTEATRLEVVGTDGYYATLSRDGGSGSYTVTASTPLNGEDPGELNDAALRATTRDYPQEIQDHYLQVTPGQLGPFAETLKAKILAEAPSTAPIDLANQLVHELQSSTYQYDTDISDLDCAGISTTECFAHFKHGFCQQYAATMAVLLRSMGVPTRIAQGFLPGARNITDNSEEVPNSNAHAWVEVYFTGYGWVTFDPTGGGVSQVGPLPTGRPVASASAKPSGSGGSARPTIAPTRRNDEPPSTSGGGIAGIGGGSVGPLVAVTGLLLVVVGALAFVAWQRGPRGSTSADDAYGMVTRLATRFGFGPRPTQTVYEYAGSLGDVLPDARPELQMVARAKVETAYGRQILGDDRIAGLKAAQRRLRIALLRLAFRRKDRPRSRSGVRRLR